MAQLTSLDIIIVVSWLVFMMAFGLIVSYRSKKKTANDYFLASNSIPWWAVGGSLIAANISAEQFIGMSGSGYALSLIHILPIFLSTYPTIFSFESGLI